MKQWYEELFKNNVESYDKESFTQGTQGEADFIEQEIKFDKTKRKTDPDHIKCLTFHHQNQVRFLLLVFFQHSIQQCFIIAAPGKLKENKNNAPLGILSNDLDFFYQL